MRIENVNESITTISDLAPGDVFMFNYEYYIKITEWGSERKVVNLDTGRSLVIGCGTRVERVNAKLVVEDLRHGG